MYGIYLTPSCPSLSLYLPLPRDPFIYLQDRNSFHGGTYTAIHEALSLALTAPSPYDLALFTVNGIVFTLEKKNYLGTMQASLYYSPPPATPNPGTKPPVLSILVIIIIIFVCHLL